MLNHRQLLPFLDRVKERFNCKLFLEETLKPFFWTLLNVGLPVYLPLTSWFWHVIKIQIFPFPYYNSPVLWVIRAKIPQTAGYPL